LCQLDFELSSREVDAFVWFASQAMQLFGASRSDLASMVSQLRSLQLSLANRQSQQRRDAKQID
jgi:hypothetical protein